MSRTMRSALLAAVLGALAATNTFAQTQPKVVVTIAPIHSLVAAVMEGLGEPELLMPAGSSPHAFALKPSQAKALREADLIIRVGPNLEAFLERPLAALGGDATIVTLDQTAGVELLEMRRGGAWEAHNHADHGHQDHGHHDHGHDHHGDRDEAPGGVETSEPRGSDGNVHNPHIWLDPRNAVAIVDHLADVFAKKDRANAIRYQANAERLKDALQQLDKELANRTARLRNKPYVVFHDAYAYFENRYRLSPAGAITVSPDQAPGAKRLGEIRKKIADAEAACVFSEPQFEPKLVATVIDGTPARSAVLDPLGVALTPGPDLYFILMRGLARSLSDCLEKP